MSGRYWFKPRRYGKGWQPASWQGWLSMLAYFAALWAWLGYWIPGEARPLPVLLAGILIPVFAITAAFLYLCWKKGAPLTAADARASTPRRAAPRE